MNTNTGGPAFPVGSGDMRDLVGMTLRDYFAAAAVQGLLAQSIGTAMGSDVAHGAKYAYEMADAMIKERLK